MKSYLSTILPLLLGVVLVLRDHLSMAFHENYYHRLPLLSQSHKNKYQLFGGKPWTSITINIKHRRLLRRRDLVLSTGLFGIATNELPGLGESCLNPLGPPQFLSNLQVGETYQNNITTIHNATTDTKNIRITRLSSSPDIFHIRNYGMEQHYDNDRKILMQGAERQGMVVAETTRSETNKIRKNSFVSWIDPNDSNDPTGDVAKKIIHRSRLNFAHEEMNAAIDDDQKDHSSFCYVERLQVAKYGVGGSYGYHHDGYSRFLTVLNYLNGIGGTYFPFGNMTSDELRDADIDLDKDEFVVIEETTKRVYGPPCGILMVGKEGREAYRNTTVNPKSMVDLQAGDAIAFYNYLPGGERDLRLIHCSLQLPIQEEKWIATCWFRSEALTGTLGWIKKALPPSSESTNAQ